MLHEVLTTVRPQAGLESFAHRSFSRSFKAKFLVFPTWIRGFQVKGTNKALCQEGLILNHIGETGRNLNKQLTEHKRATRNGDLNNNIAEHHLQTNK